MSEILFFVKNFLGSYKIGVKHRARMQWLIGDGRFHRDVQDFREAFRYFALEDTDHVEEKYTLISNEIT